MPELEERLGLAGLAATELLDGYGRGSFTPSDVTEDVIAQLTVLQERLNVMTIDMFDEAREAAAAATAAWRRGEPTGPMCGVPVTIKDLIYVRNVRGAAGSPALRDFVPTVDSAPVERLRRAGAILTCKTTTCKSGYKLTADSPLTGVTRNPWRPDRTSGGSSGGAAAAVAAGAGPLALGTDGVGSIRVPASFCGVVGLKPTYGLVPRSPGFSPPSWASLAHTGPIGRTVADVALMLGVIAGYDTRDAASLPVPRAYYGMGFPPRRLKVAVSLDLGYASVAADVRAAVTAAAGALANAGIDVEFCDLAVEADCLDAILKPIALTEQAAAASVRSSDDLAKSDQEYRDVIKQGRGYKGTDYIEASYRRAALRENFRRLFEHYDLLLTPTVATTAFAVGELGVDKIDGHAVDRHLGWSPFSWPMNLTGLPAATVPCGFDRDDLPIGLQIVGPWLAEERILHLASLFEAIRPWRHHVPAIAKVAAGA